MNKTNILSMVLTLLIPLTLFTCSLDGKLERPSDIKYNPFIERAAMPVITSHPKDYTYFVGDSASPVLTVSVADPAGENSGISYRWFSNTKPSTEGAAVIMSAAAAAYSPPVSTSSEGTQYYFVSVTHHDPDADPGYEYTSVNSKVVRISVVTDKSAAMTANAVITIDTDAKNQYVRGFGGMSTPWTNAPNLNRADVEMMFNPDKLGYNMLRIMIMPDNADIAKTMEEMINMEIHSGGSFNKIQGKMYYDFVKTVNGYGGYVLASPWSPPVAWKANGHIGGGAGSNLIPGYYPDYAKYLRSFAQLMYDNGAPIYAISIQNEPNYPDSYDGCAWSANQMRDFFVQVGHFTGEKTDPGAAARVSAFAKRIPGFGGGKPTDYVLTMNGESANDVTINTYALNNEASRDAIDLIGRHAYGSVNGPYPLAKTHGKEVWMTEHNINSGSEGGYPNDSRWGWVWQFMNDVDRTLRYCNESAFIWWTAKRFYSMIGDGTFTTSDGVVLPRGHGLSHYAKFASEMWRCDVTASGTLGNGTTAITASNVNSSSFGVGTTDAKITAYVSEDGNTISLVMFTPTGTAGSNGLDMGTVKIQLPAGFAAKGAVAMRSTAAAQSVWEDVALSSDRNAAFVEMPASTILSVKFTK